MFITERMIKARLDGTFTRVDQSTGKVETREVSKDYIPTHKMIGGGPGTGGAGKKREGFKHFTATQDECIITMHSAGYTNWKIGKLLGRKPDTIYRRIVLLKEKGRIAA